MKLGKFFSVYLILIIFFFVCAFSFGRKDVVGGFATLSVTSLLVSFLAARLLLKHSQLRWIIILTFLVKFLIGVAHFLFFYDADYFSGSGEIKDVFQADFTSYFDYVQKLSDDKESFGIFYFDAKTHYVSHQELLNIITIFMYKFGVYAMNIIPLNCLFSSLFAINLFLCLNRFCDSIEKQKGLLLLLSLFPLFLDDAIFVRDIIGQFVVSLGVVLYVLSKDRTRYLWLIPAAMLFYLQRTAYIIVPFAVYFIHSSIRKKQTKYLFLSPLVLIAAAYIMPESGGVGNEISERASRGGLMSTSIVMLPIRIIFGLIGPFPWTQFIELGLIEPAYASQLYNYIAGVMHIGCLFLLFSTSGLFKLLCKNDVFLMGLIIVAMGIVDSHMHITYIMAGSCFMVPLIYLFTVKERYNKAMLTSFLVMLGLNILWVGLGMSGIKTSLI